MQQPDTTSFPLVSLAQAAAPISSRPPAPRMEEHGRSAGGGGSGGGGFDEEAMAAGEEGERGGAGGNRWPREETLALLKIRSEMDAAFRDATLKGPLWEEVSRKLSEVGYRRSAKKCREKFENVDKYYKRTRGSRAGRNDCKTYRFFTQLEALHGAAPTAPAPVCAAGMTGPSAPSPQPVGMVPMPAAATASRGATVGVTTTGNISFSSFTSDDDEEEGSDGEDTEEMGGGADGRGKLTRRSLSGGGGGGSGKMRRLFEGLMKQLMERQEAMQQRFLEAIEKREKDRMIREEAWRRQEMARLAREQEVLAQERAMAASRDAAVISFIQKITGQTIPLPSIAASAITAMPPPSPPTPVASASPAPPPSRPAALQLHKSPMPAMTQRQPQHQRRTMDIVMAPAEPPDAAGASARHDGSGGSTPSSRWPKAEVHALIQIRTTLDTRYQEAGPKGPLWEEISAAMRRMGYNRSAKRCKEKWENINKYFKKVKESNKRRAEDSKTCPYFHQLDALYRNKALGVSGGAVGAPRPLEHQGSANVASRERAEAVTVAAPLSQTAPRAEPLPGSKNCSIGNGNGHGIRGYSDGGVSSGGMQTKASNGGVTARFVAGDGGVATKKKEMTEQTQHPQQQAVMNSHDRTDGADSDSMDEEDYDVVDDDDDVGGGNKTQYEIQFQRQQSNNVVPNASSGGSNPPVAPGTAPAATNSSFLAMVQ